MLTRIPSNFRFMAALLTAGLFATAAAANTAPSAASMAAGVYQNGTLDFFAPGVLTNATDPEDDPLTAVLLVGSLHGALLLNPDGSFNYVPEAGYSGADSFIFAASDGSLLSAPATMDITVIPVNVAPTVRSISYSMASGATLNVLAPGLLAGVSDPDSIAFTAVLVSNPGNGTLILNDDGSFDYIPAVGFAGTDTFQFAANDGQDTGAPAVVTIIVAAPNQAPTAAVARFDLNEDTRLVADLMAFCTDPDGDALTVTLAAGPRRGDLALNPDGSFVYRPGQDCYGMETFEFMLGDGQEVSGPWTAYLSIEPVNDAPLANDDRYSTMEDTTLVTEPGELLLNDSDPENDALSVVLVGGVTFGTLDFRADGSFAYRPAADFSGIDTFSYVADDGQGQSQVVTVTIFVREVNDVPSFTAGGNVRVYEDAGAVSVHWASDIVAGPENESAQILTFEVSFTASSTLFEIEPSIDQYGVLQFTLAPNAWGTADVSVVLYDRGDSDGVPVAGASNPVTFQIFVIATNDAPSFIPGGNVRVLEDCGPQSIAWATEVNAGAADAEQRLMFSITGIENPALFAAGPAIDANGVLTFTPAENVNGSCALEVILEEFGGTGLGAEAVSIAQSFYITVSAVNDAPVFIAGPAISVRGSENAVMVGWAAGISAGPADEQGQMMVFRTLSVDNPGLFEFQPCVDSMGTLYFTPAKGAKGIATISIMLVDDGGTKRGGECTSTIQTFTIEVAPEQGLEAQGSCTAGTGNMPWWLLLAAPAVLAGAVRRKRVKA